MNMKKLLLTLLTAVMTLSTVWAASPKRVLVNTAEEFIQALASDREIVVCNADGICLTPVIEQMAEAGQLRDYRAIPDDATHAPGVYYCHETDGMQLMLVGIKNLTLRSNADERRKIEVTPRYADVITFEDCQNISILSLYLGHTEEGYCSNGVLSFIGCRNILIKNSALYGCGTEGICLTGCHDFTMSDSEIFHCSYHIMHIFASHNCHFDHCAFYQNKEFEQVSIDDVSTRVVFDRCVFAKNKGTLFVLQDPKNVLLHHCIIDHDWDTGNGYKSYEDCIFY